MFLLTEKKKILNLSQLQYNFTIPENKDIH